MDEPTIARLTEADIDEIVAAFAAVGWPKPVSQYTRYVQEQERDQRVVLVARCAGLFVGYVTISWHSTYPPFREAEIPEIADFNVLPRWRRRGIGSRLLDLAEGRIAERSAVAGIGVGLFADYGAAQRLYVRRGYIPDGRGIIWHGRIVGPGDTVVADDDLVLYLTKALPAAY
ncbi:MAG TPA: GNAT family N-acetyltransferase [Thermomicrobiales bacterium]|jgi:GNAT superfamily N-acetyltransferase